MMKNYRFQMLVFIFFNSSWPMGLKVHLFWFWLMRQRVSESERLQIPSYQSLQIYQHWFLKLVRMNYFITCPFRPVCTNRSYLSDKVLRLYWTHRQVLLSRPVYLWQEPVFIGMNYRYWQYTAKLNQTLNKP